MHFRFPLLPEGEIRLRPNPCGRDIRKGKPHGILVVTS